jgi:hypothetical protein
MRQTALAGNPSLLLYTCSEVLIPYPQELDFRARKQEADAQEWRPAFAATPEC